MKPMLKNTKKAFIFAVLTLMTVFILPIKANAEEKICLESVYDVYFNPLYPQTEDENKVLRDFATNSNVDSADVDGVTYYETVEEMAQVLKQHIVNRETDITLYYTTPNVIDSREKLRSFNQELFAMVFAHTGVATEGDYIKWNYSSYSTSIGGFSRNSAYYYTFTYNLKYKTTAIQEQEVDTKVQQLLTEWGDQLNGSEYDRIKLIYDYVVSNVTYDYEHLNDNSYDLKYTAYAALLNHTSVCEGYGLLVYRLMLEVNIDCRFVAGGNHGWNIICVQDTFYYADATWDRNYYDMNADYEFFLKGTKDFTEHDSYISATDYTDLSEYNLSDYAYDPSVVVISTPEAPEIQFVYANKDGTLASQTRVKIIWNIVEGVSGYEIYRSDNPEGEFVLTKTITDPSVTSYNNSGLIAGKTYYYKMRAYVGGDDKENRIYSEYSNINYSPAAVIISNAYSNATNRIRLLWNMVDGIEGYQIWCADSENGEYRIVKTVTANDQVAYSNILENGAGAGEG